MMQHLLHNIQYHDDQQAFKEFYQSCFFRMYQFAYSFVHSKESAEEVVNDVFMNLWQKRHTLDSIQNINVYLYVAVKNASLNHLRKKRLPTPVSIDELNVQHLRFTTSPESILLTRELQARVQAAIEQLPPRCRLIFKLVKEDGLSYKEVAAILDISIKTVDTQLYLALNKLSQSLQAVWLEHAQSTHPSRK